MILGTYCLTCYEDEFVNDAEIRGLWSVNTNLLVKPMKRK